MKQEILLEKYKWFYEELDRGIWKPETAEQEHFVLVCRGHGSPRTPHEHAYMKYKKQKAIKEKELELTKGNFGERVRRNDSRSYGVINVSKIKKKFPPHNNSPKRSIIEMDPRLPKPYARFIDEPLGSRDDYKKDSAANFSRASRNETIKKKG